MVRDVFSKSREVRDKSCLRRSVFVTRGIGFDVLGLNVRGEDDVIVVQPPFDTVGFLSTSNSSIGSVVSLFEDAVEDSEVIFSALKLFDLIHFTGLWVVFLIDADVSASFSSFEITVHITNNHGGERVGLFAELVADKAHLRSPFVPRLSGLEVQANNLKEAIPFEMAKL